MSLQEDLDTIERAYGQAATVAVSPLRAKHPVCCRCERPITGLVHVRPAVRPEPGDGARWHLHLCEGCAAR